MLASRWSKLMIALFAVIAAGLFAVGATLTFVGEGVLLAAGVVALVAFVMVGVAELLGPEALE